MARRTFNANPPAGIERCRADRKPLRDGTGARCMRRAVTDGYCRQHAPDVDPCPKGDPECETGDDGSCHDGCEAPRPRDPSGCYNPHRKHASPSLLAYWGVAAPSSATEDR